MILVMLLIDDLQYVSQLQHLNLFYREMKCYIKTMKFIECLLGQFKDSFLKDGNGTFWELHQPIKIPFYCNTDIK